MACPIWHRSSRDKPNQGSLFNAGGRDTFCHRWVQPDGNKLDYGELKRDELEARGLKVVIAEEPTEVAGHAFTSGHIARITDFEMSPPAARLEAGAPGSACDATFHFPPGTVKVVYSSSRLVTLCLSLVAFPAGDEFQRSEIGQRLVWANAVIDFLPAE